MKGGEENPVLIARIDRLSRHTQTLLIEITGCSGPLFAGRLGTLFCSLALAFLGVDLRVDALLRFLGQAHSFVGAVVVAFGTAGLLQDLVENIADAAALDANPGWVVDVTVALLRVRMMGPNIPPPILVGFYDLEIPDLLPR